jgi:hypothetical protein
MAHDERYATLREGAFYWVIPAVDAGLEDDWEGNLQPARYAGMWAGWPCWHCLGIDGPSTWPMRFIGEECK